MEGSSIQCANALQTQSICILALSKKFSPEHCFEYLDYLFGFDATNEKIENISNVILHCLQNRKQQMIKNLALSVLLTASKWVNWTIIFRVFGIHIQGTINININLFDIFFFEKLEKFGRP